MSGHLCTNLCPCLMENGRSLRFGINSTQTWTDNGDKRYIFGEQSIAAARASVMIYDDNTKKWIPSGSSSGLSKVHIYQHLINNTFRVVGRKLQDHEVVINCSILKGLKYNQATQTFHQWRDNKQVYGLNFSSKEDADAFATAMRSAVDLLNNSGCRVPAAPTPQPSVYPTYQHLNGPCGDYEDIDIQQRMRSLPREDYSVMERRITSSSSGTNQSLSGPPTPASVLPVSGHHRTSSAPPAPTPAPAVNVPAAPPPPPAPPAPAPAPPAPAPAPPPPTGMLMSSSSASSLSAAPHMLMMSAPPPPPPPPAPSSNSLSRSNSSETAITAPGSLATALASAKLRKTSRGSGSESDNTYSTMRLGSSGERSQMGGMASMMDEMAKTLARRRAAAEHTTNQEPDGHTTPEGKKGWDKSNGSNKYGSSNGAESPKPGRRQRFGSVSGSDEFKVNGGIDASDLERLKADILSEFRNEINNLKQEILQAIRLNRR